MSNFITYNSSAGSGKTFTLVKEYLKIALESDNPNQYRQILAITFTNKAAAEMKERVLGALIALSSDEKLSGTPKHLFDALLLPMDKGGLGVGPEAIRNRSANVLKSILHNYNDFGISTIDKFTHKIVRTFAHDLQLPLNFNIELDEEEVLKASIDLLIGEVGSNQKLTQVLTEYALQKSEDEKSWSVDYDLLDFAKKLLKDDGEWYLEKVRKLDIGDFEQIKELLVKDIESFEKTIFTQASEAMDFVDQIGIRPDSFSRSFYTAYFKKIIEKMEVQPTDATLKIINGANNWYGSKADASQIQLIESNKSALIARFKDTQDLIQNSYSDYLVNKSLQRNLYNLAVLNELEKTLLEFKQDNNVLNISDFNKRIAAIVSNEPAPFIYERLGEKYDHYLIDEFQDTSVMQWHNLLPLVDNSLAKGKLNMVVGDAKQAIYRWRGGEVEQLLKFPEVYRHNNNPILLERQDSLARNFEPKVLQDNYRSKAEVVDFNNRFFNHTASYLSSEYKALYGDLKQGFDAKNSGGGIEILISEETDNQLYKAYNLKCIFNIIESCLKDGYHWKDIVILTRGKAEGKEIAAELLRHNIQVISAESLLLNSSHEVQFMLAFFGHLSQPENLNHQINCLNYLAPLHEKALFDVCRDYPKQPLQGFLNDFGLELNPSDVAHFDLYELSEFLMRHFGLTVEMDIYLQFFLDKVHEYVAKNDHAIPNFLEWWKQRSGKFTIVIPEGVNAIQVMTIHKSKGLEFPVVIFPFADRTVKTSEDFFWTSDTAIDDLEAAIIPINKSLLETRFATQYENELEKSRLDMINLLYVAFTRPKDRLYVVAKKGKNPSTNGSMGDYLYEFCQQQAGFMPDELRFREGLFRPNSASEMEQDGKLTFEETTYSNWRDRIKISYQAPKMWDVETPLGIGEFGTLVHSILAKIKRVSDLDQVLNSFVVKGMVSVENRQAIEKIILELFAQDEIRSLFTDFDALETERTILLPSGQAYQPDRVVLKGGETYLIDFKTGAKQASHQEQLLNYRNLLAEMGYQNIIPKLLYIKEKMLETVE